MKMILGAIALALAVPAAAQTAPAAAHDPMPSIRAWTTASTSQGKHDCKECCDKMKQSGRQDGMHGQEGRGQAGRAASGTP